MFDRDTIHLLKDILKLQQESNTLALEALGQVHTLVVEALGEVRHVKRDVRDLKAQQTELEAQQAEMLLLLKEVLDAVEEVATSGTITQLDEEKKPMAAITGTKVGGSSVFQVVWNGAMTPGAPVVWSCPDDPGISFVADPSDVTGNTVTATDVAADALTQYTLNVAGTASDGTAVTATAVVPLLAGPATGGTINQLS